MAIFTVVLGPIVAQAADYWGRKWFLVGLSFCGALGGLVTALATSMNMVIAGCCLIGTVFGAQPLLQYVLPRAILWRCWRAPTPRPEMSWEEVCPRDPVIQARDIPFCCIISSNKLACFANGFTVQWSLRCFPVSGAGGLSPLSCSRTP